MADSYSLSVIAPCLNEEVNIPVLAERLFAATDEAGISTELVLVDDGSTDGTWQAIVHCGNGTWLPGTFFHHFFKDHDYPIRSFQVHQSHKGAFTLRIVKNDQFSEDAFARILDELRQFVGDRSETTIDVHFVDEIPLVQTGKHSPVISTIDEDFQSLRAPMARPSPR